MEELKRDLAVCEAAKTELWKQLVECRKELHEAKSELDKYRKAEQDGRLVVLPCKVGDIVYGAETAPVLPLYVIEPAVYMESAEGGDFETLDNFGKTVFMTREEAEAALKGGEG